MRLITLALLAVVLGCSSTTEPDQIQVLGTIVGFNQDDPRIEVTADGRVVTVRVTTYGNGCYSKGITKTAVDGLEATITPWDRTVAPSSNVACTDILLSFTHEAELRFDAAGTARILVRGVDAGTASAGKRGETVTVERTVEVP